MRVILKKRLWLADLVPHLKSNKPVRFSVAIDILTFYWASWANKSNGIFFCLLELNWPVKYVPPPNLRHLEGVKCSQSCLLGAAVHNTFKIPSTHFFLYHLISKVLPLKVDYVPNIIIILSTIDPIYFYKVIFRRAVASSTQLLCLLYLAVRAGFIPEKSSPPVLARRA